MQDAPTWPVTALFDPRLTRPMLWRATAEVDQPGQWVLAQLEQGADSLALSARSMDGQVLASRATVDSSALGFACPAGQVCWLSVSGPESATGTAYQVDARPAHLEAVEQGAPAGRVRALAVQGDALYAGGRWGLARRQAASGGSWLVRRGRRYRGVTALVRCGGYLCASRLRPRGLVVYDPQTLEPVVSQWTVGPAWDLAVVGSAAYVANGIFGLGVYDLAGRAGPRLMRRVCFFRPLRNEER